MYRICFTALVLLAGAMLIVAMPAQAQPNDGFRGMDALFGSGDDPGTREADDDRFQTLVADTRVGIIYVDDDAPPGGDGTSWVTAFRYLQDALAVADPNYVVWVAQGVYHPDADQGHPGGSGDRTATFQLISEIELYGGFAGMGELDPDARDVVAYQTILSGDLNDDDEVGFENNDENSHHVVTGSEVDQTALLDGFTISSGNADGGGPAYSDRGAGMFNSYGNPTVTNCTFSDNWAEFAGAGMYNYHSSPTLTDCTFAGNQAGQQGGGVGNYTMMPLRGSASVNQRYYGSILVNCTFRDNAAYDGGGVYNEVTSGPFLSECSFNGNHAYHNGGGMYSSLSSPSLTHCTFEENDAVECGGGMYSFYGYPALIDCAFSGNGADYGAAVHNFHSCPAMVNCVVSGNAAVYTGAGVYNDESAPTFMNCLFSANSSWAGAGMLSVSNSSPTLTNCTFADNEASWVGGGVYLGSSSVVITNCILWTDVPEEIFGDPNDPDIVVTYSDVQGGWPGSSRTNIDEPPRFVDPNNGDYHLLPHSPCINKGNNAALPADEFDLDGDGNTTERIPFDLDGKRRIAWSIVDMGAYEYHWSMPPHAAQPAGPFDPVVFPPSPGP